MILPFGRKYSWFMRFVCIGALSLALSILFFYWLVEVWRVNYMVATTLIFIVVNFLSFLINKFGNFQTKKERFFAEIRRYYAVMLSSFFLNLLLMFVLVDILGFWYLSASLLTALFLVIYNFFMHSRFSFRMEEAKEKSSRNI